MAEAADASPVAEARSLWKLIGASAFAASLCCVPSVVWVLFAGSSAIVAADQLSNDLYFGIGRWLLYLVALALAGAGLTIHFRREGICTLDDAKRERQRIVNTSLAVITAVIVLYLVWDYIILQLIGIAVGQPWAESAVWK
ncbi:MAG: hypothetical protein MK233_05385 [Candidatus Poseidoniales archaeon]|nr:hypothetical protein [Candidatus Poseidoniales archaeon]